jgi:hypothetical protein
MSGATFISTGRLRAMDGDICTFSLCAVVLSRVWVPYDVGTNFACTRK